MDASESFAEFVESEGNPHFLMVITGAFLPVTGFFCAWADKLINPPKAIKMNNLSLIFKCVLVVLK